VVENSKELDKPDDTVSPKPITKHDSFKTQTNSHSNGHHDEQHNQIDSLDEDAEVECKTDIIETGIELSDIDDTDLPRTNDFKSFTKKLIKETDDIKIENKTIKAELNKIKTEYAQLKAQLEFVIKSIPTIQIPANLNNIIVYEHDDFYDDNLLSLYIGKRVIYIGYIGIINGEHTFKYGISADIISRETKHKQTYGTFRLVFVQECLNDEVVETLFGNELKARELYRQHRIRYRKRTELFTLSIKYDIESIKSIVLDLIKFFPIDRDHIISEYKYKLYMAIKESKNQIKKDIMVSRTTDRRYARIMNGINRIDIID